MTEPLSINQYHKLVKKIEKKPKQKIVMSEKRIPIIPKGMSLADFKRMNMENKKLTKKSKPKQNNTISIDEFKKLKKKTKHLTPKQIRLINEFEKYLTDRDYSFEKEVVYSKLFPDCKRKFRCDYFIKNNIFLNIAIVEINGGQWTSGRHTRGGVGYENDLMKMNIASNYGVPYYQFTYEMLFRREYEQFL